MKVFCNFALPMKKKYLFILFSLTLTGFQNCSPSTSQKANPEETEKPATNIGMQIKEYLSANNNKIVILDTLLAKDFLISFYKKRNYQPAWTNENSITKNGDTLIYLLIAVKDYGLNPNDYHTIPINVLMTQLKNATQQEEKENNLVKIDLLLTDAFFLFSTHLKKGILNPETFEKEKWNAKKVDSNLVTTLQNTLEKNSLRKTIESMEPQQKQYKQLRIALKNFRKEFEGKKWNTIPPVSGKDSTVFFQNLKLRLIASNDYDSTLTSDSALIKAIQKFQKKHGFNEDGRVGKNTYKALNVSIEERIKQAEVNLERWRWKNDYEQRYVWVNIPGYKMKIIDNEKVALESRIVVGQPDKQTPEVDGIIKHFIIYPFWYVPKSIATKEMLPALKKDSTYLKKRNFKVFDKKGKTVDYNDVDWNKYSINNLPYTFRQEEGDYNSLGTVKFIFNNEYGVYLHDTNSRGLFKKDARALSHGCMRVEKFREFADYLVSNDSTYKAKDLETYFSKKQQKQVNLSFPIPVHVTYFTAEADEEHLYFYMDIYGKDKIMEKNL